MIQEVLKDRDAYCQQDGALAHWAKSQTNVLVQQIDLVNDWPLNSPNLSVIGSLSSTITDKSPVKTLKILPELKAALIKEWKCFDQGIIDRFKKSSPENFKL
jgi:hypothetical protein